MKLSGRFVVLVLALLLACAVTTWMGMRGLQQLDSEMSAVVHGDMQRLLHVTHVRRLFRSMAVAERDYILEKSDKGKQVTRDKVKGNRKDLLKELDEYDRLALPEDRAQFSSLRGAYDRWIALNDRVQSVSDSAGVDAAYSLSADHTKDPVQWETVIGGLVKVNDKRLADRVAQTEHASSAARKVLLIVAFAGALFALAAGTIVFRGIRKNMQEVAAVNANLERLVEQRTRALAEREASMRLILDSTGDGLCVVNLDGTAAQERSRKLLEWFGHELPENRLAAAYLFPDDDSMRERFEMSFQQIVDDVLPFEVAADQMPSRWVNQGRTFEFSYKPIEHDGKLAQVLLMVSDITVRVQAEQVERETREVQSLVGHLLRDRNGFRVFVTDGLSHLHQIETSEDSAVLMRSLHTLKGNSYVYGVSSVGDACHQHETALVEGHLPSVSDRKSLRLLWNEVMSKVEKVVGTALMEGVHVSDAQLGELVGQLRARAEHQEILHTVELWRADPTGAALQRLAAQTQRVANSLGKTVEIAIKDDGSQLPAGMFDTFWSALVHVVRNAAYHGIEPAAERAQVGKPEHGYVWLGARVREDGRFEVQVKDDGRGIDVERLRKKAEERGLPTDKMVSPVQLIFAEGLSTAEEADTTAGRGVGMSVVAQETDKLGGRVSVNTEPGKGTAFRFSFPPVNGPNGG